jgi:hypothetical protein
MIGHDLHPIAMKPDYLAHDLCAFSRYDFDTIPDRCCVPKPGHVHDQASDTDDATDQPFMIHRLDSATGGINSFS